jgi:hypothetical protein
MVRVLPVVLLLGGCHLLLPLGGGHDARDAPRPQDLQAERSAEMPRPVDRRAPGDRGLDPADRPAMDTRAGDRPRPDKAYEGKLLDKHMLDQPKPDQHVPRVELDTVAGGAAPTTGAISWTHTPQSCPPSSCVLVVEVAVLGGAINTVSCSGIALDRAIETNWGTFSTSIWVLSPFTGTCQISVDHGVSLGTAGSSSWRGALYTGMMKGGQGHTSSPGIDLILSAPGGALIQVAAASTSVSLTAGGNTTTMWSRTGNNNYSAAAGYSLANGSTGSMNVGWQTSNGSAPWTESWLVLQAAP